ncbi:MAG: hypothetical protein IT287_09270 [Bdellovibrionaceae bacterium]|nr:hypothetical protein [Pseudobdellovibrionaceae bacterium]
MKRILVLAFSLIVTSCATVQENLAGKMGCPPEEITVLEDRNLNLSTRQFTTECRGQRFICTSQ